MDGFTIYDFGFTISCLNLKKYEKNRKAKIVTQNYIFFTISTTCCVLSYVGLEKIIPADALLSKIRS